MKLKVCGLTQIDQIHELISMETDFLGFIFYEKSPRYALNHLSLEDISKLNHKGKIGVFVNEELDKIIEIAGKANLNFIQLHGDEDENFISELREKLKPETGIIKVIRIGNRTLEAGNEIQQKVNQQLKTSNYFLFDTDSKAFGGTGKQFDWTLLNEIEIPLPYFLSGGISDENIDQIKILTQKPFALDINSKFEIEAGFKDVNKIREFKKYI
ncbi:phosphoribosylanthranilate isomerase [Chryseobacterium soldanellicola]|uniref:N-(5'-phosphoribosyl)anthranilate isomerase n=1 Tax=Chryseobacterium soldanellicola TaxID=311333 RepID=A0A1H0XT71_9FLAO|nr:phosphoribosylanthranilate isomerase [Chryseobacterium soldanellicola]SDQ06073.1 phosphoribosylanthranilate isomerase [Chryseobacterium soldanellicola]